jgi:hypothetical protein
VIGIYALGGKSSKVGIDRQVGRIAEATERKDGSDRKRGEGNPDDQRPPSTTVQALHAPDPILD